MTRSLLLAFAIGALALAEAGAAKEPKKVELCGPAGCTAITDRSTLRAIPTGGETLGEPPALASFYTMRLTVGAGPEEDSWRVYYVPSANAIAARDEAGKVSWFPIVGDAVSLMKRLVRGLQPFPAPTISSVTVDGKAVSGDPHAYLRLNELEAEGSSSESPGDWVPIDFVSVRPSPWTDAPRELMYSPSTHLLERGIEVIPVPDGIAADIEAGRTFGSGGSSALWWWLALGAVVLIPLAFVGLRALLQRRQDAAAAASLG
jgi:hypothetical protein